MLVGVDGVQHMRAAWERELSGKCGGGCCYYAEECGKMGKRDGGSPAQQLSSTRSRPDWHEDGGLVPPPGACNAIFLEFWIRSLGQQSTSTARNKVERSDLGHMRRMLY